MRRGNEPIEQKPMNELITTAEKIDDSVKALTVLIGIFTGIRANTLCHIHSDWFHYDEDQLYLRVPNEFRCLKYGTDESCGDCAQRVGDSYSPKSDAGGGRRLMIPQTWHNHYTGQDEAPTQIRKLIEHYFAIGDDDYGHSMLDGDGISVSTANRYVKQVAEEAEIGFYLKQGYIDHSKLGRVPDVMTHDLRATYCVQLMRNDANPFKAINKTGHADVDSLKPYIEFAKGEFDGSFEENFI
jgi:hypothetical protein